MAKATSPFSHADVVYSYTRAEAIADGVLVDLMQPDFLDLFRDAGIKFPCAMTIDAFSTYVDMSPELQKETGQDIKGRLWDILWMFRQQARQTTPGTDTLYFKFVATTDRLVTKEHVLKAVVGPGDQGEPVITFMHPWED